uniref:Uncharacterized protein n=1 Tax=Anopheles melas TaxID=34690 RepID=A0A182TWT5_9DIPT
MWIKLKKILGLTVCSSAGLDVSSTTGVLAYPAGPVSPRMHSVNRANFVYGSMQIAKPDGEAGPPYASKAEPGRFTNTVTLIRTDRRIGKRNPSAQLPPAEKAPCGRPAPRATASD